MSFELQQKIRQNALEMREYVTDLYQWQQEIEVKEKLKKQLKKEEKQRQQQTPSHHPIRELKQSHEDGEKEKDVNNKKDEIKMDLIRDSNTIRDYYKAWDKYDVDNELNKLEEETKKLYRPYNPYEDSKNNMRAKPKTKINIKGRRNIISDPTDLKDKGNLLFQSLQFEKAVSCYSECLQKLEEEQIPLEQMKEERKKLYCVVLSNRAMAYMKLQETGKALADATESLRYNPKYSKSYYRRGQCLKKLGKYRQCLKDFRMVKQLEPFEGKAEAEIKKIEAFLSRRAQEMRESMKIEYNANLMGGSRRIQIEEVPEFQSSHPIIDTQSNFLQEL